MKRNPVLEFWIGIFVIAGILALAYLATVISGLKVGPGENTYRLYAQFDNASGLRPRARVSIAGVTIGRVNAITVDPESFLAIVALDIDISMQEQLPADTGAQILTEGILGAKYIGLLPGGDEELLAEGDIIKDTQGAMVLENLIGDVVGRLTRQ